MQRELSPKNIGLLFSGAVASLLLGRIFRLPFLLILFPVLAIRYVRHVKLLPGILLLFVGSLAAIIAAFWGISSHMFSSTAVFVVVMAVSSFIGLLPILLDAWLFKKGVNQLWLIPVYPCAKVFLEYLGSAGSPFGIWGSQASLLAGWQPFNNVVALGGIWTLSLLVAFFSSILVYVLENGLRTPDSKSMIRWYALAIVVVAIAGLIRMNGYKPEMKVKVAVVLANDSLRNGPVDKLYEHLLTKKQIALTPGEQAYFHHAFEASNLDLLHQAELAAEAGAKIIFCAEGNAVAMKNDEKGLIEAASRKAREKGVYIGIAAEVYTPAAAKPVENKIIFIKPDGGIAFEYFKHYPIGIEKDLMVTGDGTIPTCNTPYGKLAAVICFDTDFITYARKAGAAGADILFAPSNDWSSIATLRGKITRYRALENGLTLVRPTSHGVTEMVAPTGNMLFSNNYFEHPSRLMMAEVPSRHLTAPYVQMGDWLPILALLLLTLVLLGCWLNWKRRNSGYAVVAMMLVMFAALPDGARGQGHAGDSSHAIPAPSPKQSRTVLFPAISYAPETSVALGVSAMHFYKSSSDATLSQISGNILYTFNRQFIHEANLLHYTPGSHYLVKTEIALNKFPERFYGIGNKTADEAVENITYNVFKGDAAFMRKMVSHVYAGLHYSYANYYDVSTQNTSSHVLDTLKGGTGSIKSGLGLELTFDSRDNVSNSTQGWFTDLTAVWNNKTLGSTYDYFAFDADIRRYHKLGSGAVLALQAVVNIKEGEVPFSQLSYLGGSSTMRGFYAGRYRDLDLWAVQAEYRRHLWRNWGFVLFAGAGKVSSTVCDMNGIDLQHSLGFGFRRTISKQHKVNLRMDVGYGNGQCNFYVNIGEAF